MEDILSLDEQDKIVGEIYVIINTQNGKKYIGQTRSHRKNRNKYRRFGHMGRFKDHISEATNNTKKHQCTYLNNALRSNIENFYCELIECCEVSMLDDRERYYIEHYNTLYPNGYNLTKGGKSISTISDVDRIDILPIKVRKVGYTHSKETIEKIKIGLSKAKVHMKQIASTPDNKQKVSLNIKKYYDDYKIKKLSSYKLDKPLESYVKPIYNSSMEIIDYKIYVNREVRFRVKSSSDTLEEKYNRLRDILIRAKELSGKNGWDLPKGELVTSSEDP